MKIFDKMSTQTLKNQIRAAVSLAGNRQRLEAAYFILRADKKDERFLAMMGLLELNDQRKIDFTSGLLKGLNKKS